MLRMALACMGCIVRASLWPQVCCMLGCSRLTLLGQGETDIQGVSLGHPSRAVQGDGVEWVWVALGWTGCFESHNPAFL